ncbi:Hypothetical protein NGAL_HAMBI1189_08480 [Neorhizobium galegae bv. officinalis]|uniref:Uncharacterized protein n=1 Tax=Neorhizobium galegae bv. officinalis TaxID=323656 RepID=A0A0T7GDP1_NEOGA|nr:Hypothetical protein NGAL_HAMBI1189_08480 [Neorhizobium galegae bv. officinalis]
MNYPSIRGEKGKGEMAVRTVYLTRPLHLHRQALPEHTVDEPQASWLHSKYATCRVSAGHGPNRQRTRHRANCGIRTSHKAPVRRAWLFYRKLELLHARAARGLRDHYRIRTATGSAALPVPCNIIVIAIRCADVRVVEMSRGGGQSCTRATAGAIIAALVAALISPIISTIVTPIIVIRALDPHATFSEFKFEPLGSGRRRLNADADKQGRYARQQSELFRFHCFSPATVISQISRAKMNGSITSSVRSRIIAFGVHA